MPTKTAWTKGHPTEPGLYWIFDSDREVYIANLSDHGSFYTCGSEMPAFEGIFGETIDDILFYSPIEKPEPPCQPK